MCTVKTRVNLLQTSGNQFAFTIRVDHDLPADPTMFAIEPVIFIYKPYKLSCTI